MGVGVPAKHGRAVPRARSSAPRNPRSTAATGAQTSLLDENNLSTSWQVNGFGRVTSQTLPDGNQLQNYIKLCDSTCVYGAAVVTVTDQFNGSSRSGMAKLSYLDSAGHVLIDQTWGFDGSIIRAGRAYDSLGRLQLVTHPHVLGDPVANLNQYSYDILNRVTELDTFDEAGATLPAKTAYQGLIKTLTNAKGQQRVETHNVIGQLVQVQDNAQGLTQFAYDPFGNLGSTIDPNRNVITVTYDLLGRKTALTDPDLGQITYDIDPIGQVWRQTSPNQRTLGQHTYSAYDLLGRPTARYEPDLKSYWTYDSAAMGVGKLAEAYTGSPTAKDYDRTHTYDTLGRPAKTTQVLNDATYSSTPSYDAWSRVINQTYQRGSDPAKSYDLRYNAYGALTQITRGTQVLWQVMEQDAAMRPVRIQTGNGLIDTRLYNIYTDRMDTRMLESGSALLQEGYQFDVLGNVTKRIQYWDNGGFQEDFGYDGLNRLISSQVEGINTNPLSYSYDAAGNLQGKAGVGSGVFGSYHYPAQGQGAVRPHAVQSIDGVGSFQYDNDGNLASGPSGGSNTWTSFDMPAQVSNNGATANFNYGAEHQRTLQTRRDASGNQSTVVYAGAQEVTHDSTGTTIKTYWPGGVGVEIDRPNAGTSELDWTHEDRLGSVIAISAADGTLRERLAYDPWGKRRSTDGSSTANSITGTTDNKGFTGQEMLDQLELVHLNGRIYDPYVGKFLSADPHVTDPVNGQNYNRYSYVLNNPTNLTDPTGFDAEEKKAAPPPDKKPGGCDTDCLKKAAKAGKTFVLVDDNGTVEEIALVGNDGKYHTFTAGGRQDAKNQANNELLPTGSETTDVKKINPTNDWRADSKSDQFLKEEYAKRGQAFCTANCASLTDEAAEALASERYTGAAIASHREAQWWVYQLPDNSFTFTYPWVTEIGSHIGRPPDINYSIGLIWSSGHIHWDGVNDFSGNDWFWIRNQKVNGGKRVPLYLSSGDGKLKYTNWEAARNYGVTIGATSMPPELFPGIVVKGVSINAGF